MFLPRPLRSFLPMALLACLSACGDRPAQPGAMPPPAVGVLSAKAEPVTLTTELPGRLEPWRVAEVRARVSGIVQKRLFEEGRDVQAGQVLFQIDEAPYRARLNSAEAGLAKAQANLYQAHSQAERVKRLYQSRSVSEQDLVNAQAAEKQAEADVAVASAALKSARIDLGYASVTAPISGRIGRALVTEGALVGQGEATPLATIQQVDRLYVSFTQTAREVLALRQQAGNGPQPGLEVSLQLEDGQPYPHPGRLLFADLTVDPGTAQISLRAEIPNPDGLLLPGMYVRVKLQQAHYERAYLVPQQAVLRNQQGDQMTVLDAQSQPQHRRVSVAGVVGKQWLITDGLQDGDQFVVEGFQKLRPGSPVKAVPWQAPQR